MAEEELVWACQQDPPTESEIAKRNVPVCLEVFVEDDIWPYHPLPARSLCLAKSVLANKPSVFAADPATWCYQDNRVGGNELAQSYLYWGACTSRCDETGWRMFEDYRVDESWYKLLLSTTPNYTDTPPLVITSDDNTSQTTTIKNDDWLVWNRANAGWDAAPSVRIRPCRDGNATCFIPASATDLRVHQSPAVLIIVIIVATAILGCVGVGCWKFGCPDPASGAGGLGGGGGGGGGGGC